LDYVPTVFEGSTVVEQMYSPALEGNLQGNPSTQPVKIYLPPGYHDYPNNKYPVVYLLHAGDECDYDNFYAYYGLLNTLNQLISSKTIVPMVIVTPNARAIYGNSCYTNSYVTGNWEDYIVQDVIQHVESKYLVLDQRDSRGLSGFSIGGYGTVKIAMKHPSLFNSIGLIGPGAVNFKDEILNTPVWNNAIIAAAGMNKYDPYAEGAIPLVFTYAVAFAPDSTLKPILGRFPYTADGVFIDSIWQKYLEHDPLTMLHSYSDSLHKINAIQFYIGDQDIWVSYGIEPFHQALLDNGIVHGYEMYEGSHDPEPVLDKLHMFFSNHLTGIIPTVRTSSNYYLGSIDTLVVETDIDGKLYVVPFSIGNSYDSIFKHHVATVEVLASEENEILLSEFEYGKYQVYAISSDSVVSNIPAEFCAVPDTSPPILSPENSRVIQRDSIRVSMSRNGKLCLVDPGFFFLDTLRTALDIINSSKLIGSVDALADSEVSFSTDDLSPRTYWLYGFDQYGIVTEPIAVEVVPVGIPDYNIPEIMLYPNPVTGVVSIQTNMQEKYNLSISSLNGKLIHESTMEGTSHQIDLSSFQKGVYFITIRSEDFVTTRKIIKL